MEERLNQLEERLVKLEKKERRRTIISRIKTILALIILAVMIGFGFYAYTKVKETIKPIEELTEKYHNSNWLEEIGDYFKKAK